MSDSQIFANRLLSLVFAVLLVPLSLLCYGIDAVSAGKRTDKAKTNVVGIGAYFRSQGAATDGEAFYFSSKTTLIRVRDDYKTVTGANYSALPDEPSEKYGINHIGGLSYYNGKIYAGLEDGKVWKYPAVGVYDAGTLGLEKYYFLDAGVVTRGVPWVCVNPENGLLYCADHSKKPTKLLIYDVNDGMKFIKEIPLSFPVPSIQGAEFWEGVLYAASNDETQAIYKIDVENGGVKKLIDRNLTKYSEGEGMTIAERAGEPVIVALDLGPLFINAFVREYDLP